MIRRLHRRHRARELLDFLRTVAQAVPAKLDVHLVMTTSEPPRQGNADGNLNQRYTFAVDNLARGTYTVAATPIGAQASQDTGCGELSLDQSGARRVTGSGGVSHCW